MHLQSRGSLQRRLPRSQPTEDELFAMRRAAWRRQQLIVLRPTDVRDEIIRQALINEAVRLYGPREGA